MNLFLAHHTFRHYNSFTKIAYAILYYHPVSYSQPFPYIYVIINFEAKLGEVQINDRFLKFKMHKKKAKYSLFIHLFEINFLIKSKKFIKICVVCLKKFYYIQNNFVGIILTINNFILFKVYKLIIKSYMYYIYNISVYNEII